MNKIPHTANNKNNYAALSDTKCSDTVLIEMKSYNLTKLIGTTS